MVASARPRTPRGATPAPVQVEEGDRVVAGVVQAADETSVVRTESKPRWASRSRTRGSLRIWAMARPLGPPRTAAAGAAVVGGLVRVVQAVEPWPSRNTSRAKRRGQPDVAQQRVRRWRPSRRRVKPTWPFSGPGVASCAFQLQLGRRRRLDEAAEPCGGCGPSAAGTGCGRPAGRRPARRPRREQGTQGETAAADVEAGATPCPGTRRAWRGARWRLRQLVVDLLRDPVLRPHARSGRGA